MSEIHDIRPEDSVSLANLDVTSHTYFSLHDPWSRPATRSNAITTNGYLHAFPSNHSGLSSRTHNSHHRRRRSSVRQSEELKDVYKKIKIFFAIICVVVSVMLASVVLMYLRIGVFASGDDDQRIVAHYVSEKGKYEQFSLCAKCGMLQDEQIIRETRSSKNREFCCFRTIGKLIDVFHSFVQRHSNHLSEDSASKTLNGRHPSEHSSDTGKMAHCNLTTGHVKTESSALHLSCKVKVGFKVVDKKLVVLVSGFYYIYSHLLLNQHADHKVFRYRKGQETVLLHTTMSRQESQDQDSLLEGIFLLVEGDTISVFTGSRIENVSTNDFGIFKV